MLRTRSPLLAAAGLSLFALATVAVVLLRTGADTTPVTLNIAAASDLKFAMDEVAAAFQKSHPTITVRVTYGSSGNFYGQLVNKAPFDLFFSADVNYPIKLADQGFALAGSQFTYAQGRLVVWLRNDSKVDVAALGIRALEDPSVRKIAVANPQHAPYGRAAEAAMKSLGVYDAVKSKLVIGESISQAAQFVQSGAADIGVIALSLAVSPTLQKQGRYWEVPETAYPKLEQTAVTMKSTKVPDAAKAMSAFLTAPEGRTMLKKYGFRLPGE